jgi:hypothetical protein
MIIKIKGEPETKAEEKKNAIREDAPPAKKEREDIRPDEYAKSRSAVKDKKSRLLFYVW